MEEVGGGRVVKVWVLSRRREGGEEVVSSREFEIGPRREKMEGKEEGTHDSTIKNLSVKGSSSANLTSNRSSSVD